MNKSWDLKEAGVSRNRVHTILFLWASALRHCVCKQTDGNGRKASALCSSMAWAPFKFYARNNTALFGNSQADIGTGLVFHLSDNGDLNTRCLVQGDGSWF